MYGQNIRGKKTGTNTGHLCRHRTSPAGWGEKDWKKMSKDPGGMYGQIIMGKRLEKNTGHLCRHRTPAPAWREQKREN